MRRRCSSTAPRSSAPSSQATSWRPTGSLVDAYNTDVRPLCAKVRVDLGAAADPIAAFRADGYLERITQARAGRSRRRMDLTADYPGVRASWP